MPETGESVAQSRDVSPLTSDQSRPNSSERKDDSNGPRRSDRSVRFEENSSRESSHHQMVRNQMMQSVQYSNFSDIFL